MKFKATPRNAVGENWKASGNVQFKPVEFDLVKVGHTDRNFPDQEYAAEGFGAYSFQPFDPWHKGDLVVICIKSRVHALPRSGVKSHDVETWRVMRRATVPSANTQKYDIGEGFCAWDAGRNVEKWRIPYRNRQAAYKLLGQDFDSMADLIAAMIPNQFLRQAA